MKIDVIPSCVRSNRIPYKNIKDSCGKPIRFDDEDVVFSTLKTVLG